MGFSIAVAAAIFFTTFLFFSIIIYSEINSSNNLIKDAQDDKFDREMDRENTDIDIVNISYNKISLVLTVNVKNEGSIVLNPNKIDFFGLIPILMC